MAGRPTVVTKEVLEKLNEAFLQGLSDEEACLWAGIDPKTLYNYCTKYPYYSSKKEQLKQHPKMLAKMTIYKDIKEGKVDTARWYLERKAKDEFSPRDDTERLLREARAKWEHEKRDIETSTYLKSVVESLNNPNIRVLKPQITQTNT